MTILTALACFAFAAYLGLVLTGAAMAVFCTSLVRALVGLIATLLGVAGMYFLLQSPFLAFMQILIYVGAVCVLVFFAIMMTSAAGGDENRPLSTGRFARALVAGMVPLAVLVPVIFLHPVVAGEIPAPTPLADLGRGLMEDFVVPFELISIILLVAMAGAVFLAWERRK